MVFHSCVRMATAAGTALVLALALHSTATTTTNTVEAHPGQHPHARSLTEIRNSALFHHHAHRSLAACTNTDKSRKLNQLAAERRQAKIQQLRAEVQQRKRQRQRQRQLAASDVLATSHKSDLTNIDPAKVDSATLFGSTNKCVLEPEVTQGPYYVKGELIRNDIRETQAGINLYAELQFVDVTSCEVVPDYYVDFWHCNSTGVYSGVVASGNGDSSDASNINATHGRGLYPTDKEGVVQFVTKFPGHYTGRTSHIHILGNHGGSVLANKTYSGGSVASVGQLFFDQDLLTAVAASSDYAKNTQTVTLNSDDSIFSEAAATGFDPVMQYVYLGDDIEDGIFAWISVGVDTSVSKSVSAAATLTASGGVASSGNTGMGGGGMGGGRPGGRPGQSATSTPSSSTGSSSSSSDDAAATTTPSTPSTTSSANAVSSTVAVRTVAVVLFAAIMALQG